MNRDEFLWVERYRPKTVAECILPPTLKSTFEGIIKAGEVQNMILAGTAGLGKTTVARAICDELELDCMLINGSEEAGIDVLRNKIKSFASTVSLHADGKPKVVILDEADYLNAQSTQPALRGFIEEFSKNCRFILTCNFKNRLIEPLHSRCPVYEFNVSRKEIAKLAPLFHKRLKNILDKEGVKYDEKTLAELIIKHAPDWRRVINECQRYSSSGIIDAGIFVNLSDENFKQLTKAIKNREFKDMRKWVANNIDLEPASIFRRLFDTASEFVKPASIPQLVLILAEYQYKNAFVCDHELNLVACLTEIMSSVECL